jgi:transcriptional regulator with XRE-family HTH domain
MNFRLRQARQAAGFRSARAAATRFGWTPSTYASHENGQNNYRVETAEKYALAFGTRAVWLLHGEGISNNDEPMAMLRPIIRAVVAAILDLYRIPVRSPGARRILTEAILEFLAARKALVSSGRTAELELELLRSLLRVAGEIHD